MIRSCLYVSALLLPLMLTGASSLSALGATAWAKTTPSALPKLDLKLAVRPVAGKFVTRNGENFQYNGRPIRFWGMNLQLGEFKSYQAIDNCIKRLRNMGCNAVRIWASGYPFYSPESAARGEMVTYQKGDGSKLDLHDYFIARLEQEGLFIHNTSLGSHGPPLEHWRGLDIRLERKNKTGYDFNFYNVFPIMRYLHEDFLAAQESHIKMYLNRVNPYTGQRYAQMSVFATWELTNENHTVARVLKGDFEKWPPAFKKVLTRRWNAWLVEQYADRAGLVRAWGILGDDEDPGHGTVAPGPTYAQVDDFPAARGRNFVRFVQDMFIAGTKRLEAVARSCAPAGKGINIAPITANTHADRNLHGQYASSVLDFAACAIYSAPYTTDTGKLHYPWAPISTERPYFYNLNFQTIADKPFVVYEYGFFRPYPYRAEWPTAVALLGAGLGWDGLYLYAFGQPGAIGDAQASDTGFLSKRLTIPPGTKHDQYCQSFHYGNDEVLMASMAITGQAFINGIAPNRDVTRITYGQPAIQGPKYARYDITGPAGRVPHANLPGGITEWYSMPNLYRQFMHTSVRSRLMLAFDPNQKEAIRIDGPLSDLTVMLDEDRQTLHPSDDITWDPKRERIVLDSPHSKIVVGFIGDGHTFEDGIKLGPLNCDFAFFGIVSRDGKPIAQSKDLLVTLVSQAQNTGYAFDPQKIQGPTLGHINGVTNLGTTPVIVQRVQGQVVIPNVKGEMSRYDFACNNYRRQPINGKISFSANEPLFLAQILRR